MNCSTITRKHTICVVLLTLFILPCFGGSNPVSGSRSAALGNFSILLADAWSSHNNPAALALLSQSQLGLFHEQVFLVEGLSTTSLAAAFAGRPGTFGLHFLRTGFSGFNSNRITISFGRSFGPSVSIGIGLDYGYTATGLENENIHMLAASIGSIVSVGQYIRLGFHIYNPYPINAVIENISISPSIIKAAIAYSFRQLLVGLEIEKGLNDKLVIHCGTEYNWNDKFWLRVGVESWPLIISFGCGLKLQRIQIDISSKLHQYLGYSPQLSISYRFKK